MTTTYIGRAQSRVDGPAKVTGRAKFAADVNVPGLGGLDVLETSQSEPAWRTVPVVILTGYSDTHGTNRAAQLGARRCMVKAAFSVADMMNCVRELTH